MRCLGLALLRLGAALDVVGEEEEDREGGGGTAARYAFGVPALARVAEAGPDAPPGVVVEYPPPAPP